MKLPFPIPDPISDYEKSLYPDMNQYLKSVMIPKMLIKLRQGVGRLIRSETDTGVISILDVRASDNDRYRALDKTYHRRQEQIKSTCYSISNYIARNYDCVLIGDYTPSLETAKYNTMHRSMLNQTIIGKFRTILEWVMIRSGKQFKLVDEHETTKRCSICGHSEKKNPSIREFICHNCGRYLNRDINSSINIAKKVNILSGSDYVKWELSYVTYTAKWDYRKSKILFTAYASRKTAYMNYIKERKFFEQNLSNVKF